jgi:hypothetical protein
MQQGMGLHRWPWQTGLELAPQLEGQGPLG